MSNTVDALKNLYKTLTGQDYSGDPNPTDAEMIDAIAKDASGGGSGGGGINVIDIEYDDHYNITTKLDPDLPKDYFHNVVFSFDWGSTSIVGTELISDGSGNTTEYQLTTGGGGTYTYTIATGEISEPG